MADDTRDGVEQVVTIDRGVAHAEALAGFKQVGRVLDAVKAQAQIAGRQLGLINRQVALLDQLCGDWSKLLQGFDGFSDAELHDMLKDLRVRSQDPTKAETDALRELQELARQRPAGL